LGGSGALGSIELNQVQQAPEAATALMLVCFGFMLLKFGPRG
jgi:hypothetical protein